MRRSAQEILRMSDEKLMEYTLSDEVSSLGLGQAAMEMRAAARMAQATKRIAVAT
jgi:hypothetical protein